MSIHTKVCRRVISLVAAAAAAPARGLAGAEARDAKAASAWGVGVVVDAWFEGDHTEIQIQGFDRVRYFDSL